jgi:hypothetical protein
MMYGWLTNQTARNQADMEASKKFGKPVTSIYALCCPPLKKIEPQQGSSLVAMEDIVQDDIMTHLTQTIQHVQQHLSSQQVPISSSPTPPFTLHGTQYNPDRVRHFAQSLPILDLPLYMIKPRSLHQSITTPSSFLPTPALSNIDTKEPIVFPTYPILIIPSHELAFEYIDMFNELKDLHYVDPIRTIRVKIVTKDILALAKI